MELEKLLQWRPWWHAPSYIRGEPAGMLGSKERALFYHLAAYAYRGDGAIVDAGSFVGKSAFFFAKGLTANPAQTSPHARVHCFDNFLVNEGGTVAFLRDAMGIDRKVGDSTRDVFESQVAPVRGLIDVHAGDFLQQQWQSGPIEILMVDIAKSERLMSRVVEQFFPNLLVNRSIVIHQDYHAAFTPWIAVVMEFFADHFECLIPRVDYSVVYRYVRPIPAHKLARAIAYDFSPQEELELIRGAIQRLPANHRQFLALAHVWLRRKSEHLATWLAVYHETSEQIADYHDSAIWGRELAGLHSYAEDSLESLLGQRDGWGLCLEQAEQAIAQYGLSNGLSVIKGAALSALGRHAEAVSVLRAGLELPRPSVWSFVVLSQALGALRRHEEALAVLLRGMRVEGEFDGQRMRALVDAAAIHLRVPGIDLAAVEGRLGELEHVRGEGAEFWLLRSHLCMCRGDHAAAAKCLGRAAQIGASSDRVAQVQSQHGG